MRVALTLILFSLLLALGCGEYEYGKAPKETKKELGPFPYQQIPTTGEDPGEDGPDDSTELDAIEGKAGKVKFTHFTHSSNREKGYRIPCQECHHKTAADEEPSEGCADDCHKPPLRDSDPAHMGPDDNLVLAGDSEKAAPVPFNHFTHSSTTGYKIACDKCHHKGEMVKCSDCHKKLAMEVEDGKIKPKAKRAFHFQCKRCHEAIKKNKPDSKVPTVCEACHTEREIEFPQELSLNRALHIQCIGCHQKLSKAVPKAKAPTRVCTGCHEPIKEPAQVVEKKEKGLEVKPDAGAEKVEEIVRDPELEKNKGPENITIDHVKKKKSGVSFPHLTHQELDETCYGCHHKGLKDPTCRTCHKELVEAKKAYHKQCIPCHKDNDVPAKCNDCHPK